MATGDAILNLAVQKLGDFLIQEANFLVGVKDKMVFIRDELIWMHSFLKDAEQKQGTDERIRLWVAEVRSIAFAVEDIIDSYYTEIKGKEPSKSKLLTASLQKCCCVVGETNVNDIGTEIKALQERLSIISRKREDYGIGSQQEIAYAESNNRLRDLRITTSHADEKHFVGFDDDIVLLETQLFLSTSRRSVVSILGMGGLGKTSLARKLYNTNKDRFELHAWVCVSQEWNTKDLFVRIIMSLRTPTDEELKKLEKMDDDEMKRYLHQLVKNKRYLVVIDDMWDEHAWEFLRSALPDNQEGSRVIITTRNAYVAEVSDERTYVHKLRRLRGDESWELFCKLAFSQGNGVCSEDLEIIGKEMVAKCDGLPLAIIVLGGLLSRKESHEWYVVKKYIWKALIDKSVHISDLLELSYDDLSRELKSCFLYLGIFPEDYEICCDKLVQLWIAEGLIPSYEGVDLEELAESYINELNARSLIEVFRTDFKLDSTCRVHDLLRDLTVNKAKELDFFHICEEYMNPYIKPFSTRRIAFRSGFERFMANDHSHTQVHTLSFLNYYNNCLDDDDVTKLLTLINTRLKSLRVLDLEGVKVVTPESELKLLQAMGKLVHLRYLGLFQTDIDELPESIWNLQSLQAVSMLNGSRIRLPIDTYKLKQLRLLKGYFITKTGDVIVPPTSFEDLTNLHSLQHIDISGWLRNEESDELAFEAFSKLCNIRVLSVLFKDANYRLSIEPLFSCKNLSALALHGSIKSLPMELHKSLPSLAYLYLIGAEFVQDPLPALEKLPNLLVLSLGGFKMKSLIITATGFYKLLTLSILEIPEDMNLQIEEGALPSLRRIHIAPLENFTLPERFNNITF